ncbi:ketopantoate reductase PanE/ApbA C terminal-domain-containing protein [Plectosphaerella plurivora]|uniref:Ketopantoate reductase PanE/ApbA C terminal-domain-containing protein n=1 Tax=Plectosphaerella plurivora TaxID=936078 RepID=A0A9P9A7R0_9PEZI|nr:ketopantoate reductase PanE/ApbA C terminal-domain-containing protein [Plectosphaerella plurivora]
MFPERNVLVSLVARSNYAAIAETGVQLETHTFGNYNFKPEAAFPSVQAAASAVTGETGTHGITWDYVFVTTKALPDRSDDSAIISPLVGPTTCIVLIQNGVGVEAPFRKRFPLNPIVSAVTVISAEQITPGVVRQNRWTRVSIGPYTDGLGTGDPQVLKRGSQAVEQLALWWGPGWGAIRDIDAHDEVGLQTVRWHKLCINSAFNPSAVLSGGRGNADIVTDPELREHVRGVMQEIRHAVPRILGRPFPEGMATPEKIIKSTERNTGARPSMLLDWEAGRPLELEVILGNPVRLARAKGVEMPRLQSMYALLKSAQALREARQAESKSRL